MCSTLSTFVVAVREKYHDRPFHNFHHAFSVMHAAFLVLTQERASQALLHSCAPVHLSPVLICFARSAVHPHLVCAPVRLRNWPILCTGFVSLARLCVLFGRPDCRD